MPSPIAHSLASAALYKLGIRGSWASDWKFLLFLIFCGNAPDLDFIPGFWVGTPYRYHHGFSHSLLGTMLAGLVLWGLYGFWRRVWKKKELVLILSVIIVHPILDAFVKDPSPPMGVPFLYPFVKGSWMSSKAFFERTSLLEPFWSRQNLLAFGIELMVFFPLVLSVSLRRRRKLSGFRLSPE